VSLWSRGEELISESFPELIEAAKNLPPGTILDGEILVWDFAQDRVQPFQSLQQRTTRKRLTPAILKDKPAVFLAYDLIALDHADLRQMPLSERRLKLENLRLESLKLESSITSPAIRISPRLSENMDWQTLAQQRAQARRLGVEGLMLKRLDSFYGIGRTKASAVGEWWKWKIDPLSIDAVLIYAQAGHGRRASLYTDYTFAVWESTAADAKLIPFAKAYSGLTDAEIRKVDAVIKKTTIDKFGPVRSVEPTLVFEVGFEGIQLSTRHKAGIAVRFPRILRWRLDKPVREANTMDDLRSLLGAA
jgi:DNA ligase 1